MSSILPAAVALSFSVTEYNPSFGFGSALTASIVHASARALNFGAGTGANNADVVYSARQSIANGAPLDLDVRGSLTSRLDGSTVSFPLIVGIIIVNNSSTTGQSLTVGQGSNPVTTYLTGTTPGIIIGSGGFLILTAPVDGYATTAATADIIRIASATGTVVTDICILGRQS